MSTAIKKEEAGPSAAADSKQPATEKTFEILSAPYLLTAIRQIPKAYAEYHGIANGYMCNVDISPIYFSLSRDELDDADRKRLFETTDSTFLSLLKNESQQIQLATIWTRDLLASRPDVFGPKATVVSHVRTELAPFRFNFNEASDPQYHSITMWNGLLQSQYIESTGDELTAAIAKSTNAKKALYTALSAAAASAKTG